jgi:hypothetical protein
MTTYAARPAEPTGAKQPRIYDLAEGYGSVYGRYVRNRLCRGLIGSYAIESVLEAPCNAEAYFASPGTQSVVFAEAGCAVTLLHPDAEIVSKTRDFWAALGARDTQIFHQPDLARLPFEDRQFDLVWNFDSIPLLADPQRFICEMARVARQMVMVILPNPWNIGYPIHRLLNRVQQRTSLWGASEWMDAGRVARVLRSAGMTMLDTGLVDMPPWPGFDILSAVGQLVRRNTVAAHEDRRTDAKIERMLHRLTFIEYAPLPEMLKTPFAHQRYLLAGWPRD